MEAKLTIEAFSEKGWGIGYLATKEKVEVPHAFIGDELLVDVYSARRRPRKGRLLQIRTPSLDRVEPLCPHSRLCGGCSWQEYAYPSQLKQKQKWIETLFEPWILEGTQIFPMEPCDSIWHYRNKMEFAFSENAAKTQFLGLRIAGADRYVFSLRDCFLGPKWFAEAVKKTQQWWSQSGIPAFHPHTQKGQLITLTLREGTHTQEKLVFLTVLFQPEEELALKKQLPSWVEAIKNIFPKEVDLSVVLQRKYQQEGVPTTYEREILLGKGFIWEKLFLLGKMLWMKVSPTSFCQPNTLQAQKLYEKALQLLQLQPEDCLYDLYAGSGALAMVGSFQARKVIAIEQNPAAIADAKENLLKNQISNITFYQADVGKGLTQLCHLEEKPQALIVDPPRAGLDTLALQKILALNSPKIVYISCNPRTQRENARILCQAGYQLKTLVPIDQFPHTPHMENIAFFTL